MVEFGGETAHTNVEFFIDETESEEGDDGEVEGDTSSEDDNSPHNGGIELFKSSGNELFGEKSLQEEESNYNSNKHIF